MSYTKELIDEVKRIYPDSPTMHQLAENGGVMLGRYLDDSCKSSIDINIILNAKTLEEIQTIARKEKEKVHLYNKWCNEYPRPKTN